MNLLIRYIFCLWSHIKTNSSKLWSGWLAYRGWVFYLIIDNQQNLSYFLAQLDYLWSKISMNALTCDQWKVIQAWHNFPKNALFFLRTPALIILFHSQTSSFLVLSHSSRGCRLSSLNAQSLKQVFHLELGFNFILDALLHHM